MKQHFSRRTLMTGLVAGAGMGAVGLAGCTGGSTPAAGPSTGGQATARSVLPTFNDPVTAKPDLVSKYQGMSGFFHYPDAPKASVAQAPLHGETVTALTYTYDPIAPGLAQNPMWQAVNAAIGGKLDISYVASADYPNKLATTLAGNELPDLVSVLGDGSSWPAQFPALLKAKFTDLSEHLSGDAVKAYPNLAGIPSRSWQRNVVGGGLWGIPIARVPIPSVGLLRADLLQAAGLSAAPASMADLSELLKALTVPARKQFGGGDPGAVATFVLGSMGVSNGWTEKDGKFTYEIEFEQYEKALSDVAGLWKAGVFHPESLTATNNTRNDWFTNGVTPLVFGGYSGWSKYEMWGEAVPGFKASPLKTFGYDSSSKPVHPRGGVQASMTLISKTDPARVKLLLGLLNWLAAPFGSSEELLKSYGIKGTTFTVAGSDPILTESGKTLRLVPFGYVGSAPQVIYDPGKERVAKDRFDYQEAALPLIQPDPTLGLYSETSASSTAKLARPLNDVRNGILTGRIPIGDWKAAVTAWRTGGGDTMRKEYEAAFAEAKSR